VPQEGENTAAAASHAPLPELTRELLDGTIHNITTILRTPEQLFVPRRAVSSLRDALKKLDMFYPVVLEGESEQATRDQVGGPGVGAGAQPVGGRPEQDVHQ
jgi:hypothetical protein